MTTARDQILARIRRGLTAKGPAAVPAAVHAAAFRRVSDADRDTRIAEFAERAAGYKVHVERASSSGARETVARMLGERGHTSLALPADFPAELAPEGFDLRPDEGLDDAAIAACDGVLTLSACAIAQTGTLVLDHGPGQGRRKLTLLPDYHLCLVMAEAIVGLVPEAVARLAPAVNAGRPLTFISGPSATSDIELSRVEGVHGPRVLDVLVVTPD